MIAGWRTRQAVAFYTFLFDHGRLRVTAVSAHPYPVGRPHHAFISNFCLTFSFLLALSFLYLLSPRAVMVMEWKMMGNVCLKEGFGQWYELFLLKENVPALCGKLALFPSCCYVP